MPRHFLGLLILLAVREGRKIIGYNAAELALVEAHASRTPTDPLKLVMSLVRHPNVLLLSLSGFFVNIGWIFWSPGCRRTSRIICRAAHGLYGLSPTPEATERVVKLLAGPLTALTGIAGMCGNLSGGVLADFLLRKFGPIWGRRIPGGGRHDRVLHMACLITTDVRLFIVLAAAITSDRPGPGGAVEPRIKISAASTLPPCSALPTCAAIWVPPCSIRSSATWRKTKCGPPCSSSPVAASSWWPAAGCLSIRRGSCGGGDEQVGSNQAELPCVLCEDTRMNYNDYGEELADLLRREQAGD
jgi:hypothetical protein